MDEKNYPEPTVGALIFDQEDNVFLVISPKWKGKYSLPGGHIELGETIKQAVTREVKEETNLDIFDIKFQAVQEFIFGDDFYKKKHFIFLDYICKTKDTNAVLDGKEGTEYIWATIDEALELPLNPYTRNTILEYKRKH